MREFAPRFVDGHARANRHKPSGVAARETILRLHLVPALGHKRLDAITTEEVQQLKTRLARMAPKTINNVLVVLSVLLKKALEWAVIDRMPCSITLLAAPKPSMAFHDFEPYDRLVAAAEAIHHSTYLLVLLGGDAGLRIGEMIALQWSDVDLGNRQLCIQRSDWNGQVTAPKGGRLRYVNMTVRLATALREHRHLRSPLVLCRDNLKPFTRSMAQYRIKRAACDADLPHKGGSHFEAYVLLTSHDAWRVGPQRRR